MMHAGRYLPPDSGCLPAGISGWPPHREVPERERRRVLRTGDCPLLNHRGAMTDMSRCERQMLLERTVATAPAGARTIAAAPTRSAA